MISPTIEPENYQQVVQDPKWRGAMTIEIVSLEANNT